MLVLGVKYVGPVGVHHHAGFMARSVAVSGDMIARVKNFGSVARFDHFTG